MIYQEKIEFHCKLLYYDNRMQDKEVNIYLNNRAEIDNICKDASPHEKYIILMNQSLHMENIEVSKKNRELESRIDELEEENENFDTSKRYTRGLLKNLVELEKLRSKIAELNKNKYESIYSNVKKYISEWKYNFRILEALFVLFFGIVYMNINNMYEYIILISVFIPPFVFVESFFYSFRLSKKSEEDEEIKKTEEIIKKISDSQDFLNEYIDCI